MVCEKPVAMSSEELQVMMDTASRTGSLFTIHQNRRMDADYLLMREAAWKKARWARCSKSSPG